MSVEPRKCYAPKCGALVLDLKNARTGRLAAIDAEPTPRGNIKVDREAGLYWLTGYDVRETAPRHVNHYATCKDPKRFRPGPRTRG